MEEKTLSLKKGKSISLTKGLKGLKISLKWEENDSPSRYGRRTYQNFDIDLIIIELDENGKALSPDHLVFFNSDLKTKEGKFTDPEEAVIHSGDDTTGGDGGEECTVNISNLNPKVSSVLFMANIYDGITRRQNFGMIKNAVVEVYEDENDIPKVVYELGDNFENHVFLSIGSLDRKGGNSYIFNPIGMGNCKELIENLSHYGLKFE